MVVVVGQVAEVGQPPMSHAPSMLPMYFRERRRFLVEVQFADAPEHARGERAEPGIVVLRGGVWLFCGAKDRWEVTGGVGIEKGEVAQWLPVRADPLCRNAFPEELRRDREEFGRRGGLVTNVDWDRCPEERGLRWAPDPALRIVFSFVASIG